MASLTEISHYGKKIIKFGLIGLMSIIIFKIALTTIKDFWEKLHPPPPPPPTVSFDKLPPLQFPKEEQPTDLEFKLETPTGALPELGEQAKVYLSPYQRPNLLALERAKQEALQLGFSEEPMAVSGKIYRWTKEEPLHFTLEMDIFSGAFTFSYSWQNDQSLLVNKSVPDKKQAIDKTKNFLRKIKRLENDLVEGRIETAYLKLSGAKLVPAPSLSEADFVKVEIFRKSIEDFPVLTADPKKGLVSALISGASGAKQIIQVEFNYFPINYDSWATYPIKLSSRAWEELKNGQAFVTSWDKTGERIVIRRISLGYYDSWDPQQYLQPVFVFEGDNNFVALLPAVTDEWIE